MNRTTRAATVALAAAIALGISTPAALAVRGGHEHPHPTHEPAGGPSTNAQRQALRQIARIDSGIARALSDSRVGGLGTINDVDVKGAVLANAAADRASLADLDAAVRAAGPDFDYDSLRQTLRCMHPENYRLVVNALRHASKIDAAADALGGVPEVDAAVDDAVAKAVAITALSLKTDFRPIFVGLAQAEGALEAAQATVPTPEPTP